MKKFKIILLISYIAFSVALIASSCLPLKASKKQSDSVGSIIGSFFNNFIDDKLEYATSISTNHLDEEYFVGEKLFLNAKVIPENATYASLNYSSSDDSIASVDEKGNVFFHKAGRVYINILQNESHIDRKIGFDVKNIIPTNLEIEVVETLKLGESTMIMPLITPNTVTDDKVSYEIDNDTIEITNNLIYAKKIGIANIIARTSNGLEKHFTIEILPNDSIVLPSKITIKGPEKINVGENASLEAIVTPNDTTSKLVIWEGMDDVLSIDDTGHIKGQKAGVSTIKAYSADRSIFEVFKVECVNILPIFKTEEIVMRVGKAYQIEVQNEPTFAKCAYSSSDDSIVTIGNDGTIIAHKVGNATVKIVCDDGTNNETSTIEIVVLKQLIQDKVTNFSRIIRKFVGHFMVFVAFGIISSMLYYYWLKGKQGILLCFTSGLFMATITEVIQLFVDGRVGSIIDVLIDYGGYLIGVGLFVVVVIIIKKIKQRKE